MEQVTLASQLTGQGSAPCSMPALATGWGEAGSSEHRLCPQSFQERGRQVKPWEYALPGGPASRVPECPRCPQRHKGQGMEQVRSTDGIQRQAKRRRQAGSALANAMERAMR